MIKSIKGQKNLKQTKHVITHLLLLSHQMVENLSVKKKLKRNNLLET